MHFAEGYMIPQVTSSPKGAIILELLYILLYANVQMGSGFHFRISLYISDSTHRRVRLSACVEVSAKWVLDKFRG